MFKVSLAVIVIAVVLVLALVRAGDARAAPPQGPVLEMAPALAAGQVNAADPLAANNAVQCDSTDPTPIPAAATNMNGRAGMSIQNLGPNAIWIGYTTATTTAALGTKVAAGSMITVALSWNKSLGLQQVYCLADTADQVSPADTRWMQLR